MKKQNRNFGLLVGGALILIGLTHQRMDPGFYRAILIAGTTLCIIALAASALLNRPRILWEKLGHVLGIINTYLLLTIFFFLILTPLGLIKKIMVLFKRTRSTEQASYWQDTIANNNFNQQY